MEEESYPMVEIFAGFGDHHLTFTYYKADYSGSETLEETIEFGGVEYAADDEVDSTLEYTVMDFAYQWEVIDKADLVTEMKPVKHYYDQGIQARIGIEK